MEEPVADMVRGILDGHIVLDREIAERGRYPAINIRRSVSRSLPDAANDDENALLLKGRSYIGVYEDAKPLIQAGLYVPGADPQLDAATIIYPPLDNFVGTIGLNGAVEAFEYLNTLLNPDEEKPNESEPTV
jgi:flagellum-specific ATP synthase